VTVHFLTGCLWLVAVTDPALLKNPSCHHADLLNPTSIVPVGLWLAQPQNLRHSINL
jgi:hypothetical protein